MQADCKPDLAALVNLDAGALEQAQHALLVELDHALEIWRDQIRVLLDRGLGDWPVCADARAMPASVSDLVAALDALGWMDAAGQRPTEPDPEDLIVW